MGLACYIGLPRSYMAIGMSWWYVVFVCGSMTLLYAWLMFGCWYEICAIVAAFHQARPEFPVPLSHIIIINEGMVLLATLVYGIFAHFAIAIINRLRK